MSLLTFPWPQLLDANGDTYPGAKLSFFETGTSTLASTYTDAALSVAHTNPVVADSQGVFPPIYLAAKQYKVILRTAANVTLFTADPVNGSQNSVATIAALSAIPAPSNGTTVMVTEEGRGGLFVYDETQSAVDNGGTIIDGWVRRYDGPASVKWFGAVGDGTTDDTSAVQSAVNYCAATGWLPMEVTGLCKITSSINIDREVDTTTSNFHIIGSGPKAGFYTDQAINIFSNSYGPSAYPTSEFVNFQNLHFEASTNVLDCRVLNGDRYLRVRFSDCYFRNIRCARTTNYLQSYSFDRCNIRNIRGWFLEAATGGAAALSGAAFDCHWTENVFEKSSRGVAEAGFLKAGLRAAGSSFHGGLFQGNYGPFYDAAETNGVDFAGIYFELNTDQDIKLGTCYGASISGCLFDSPLSGGDKWSVNASGVKQLSSSGNYFTTKGYLSPPAPLAANDTGIVSSGDYAGTQLFSNLDSSQGVFGSFDATLLGFAVNPSITVRYVKTGRLVTLSIPAASGTSNQTFMYFELPAALSPTGANHLGTAPVSDNGGALAMSRVLTNADGVQFYSSLAGDAFTASGAKSIGGFVLSYFV